MRDLRKLGPTVLIHRDYNPPRPDMGVFAMKSVIDGGDLRIIATTGIEWLPIAGYEGLYDVSNDGRVRALPKTVRIPNGAVREHSLIELSTTNDTVYPRVTLCKDGRREKPFVHVLVARAFIPNPHGYPEVNHRNFDKSNARVTNLEWCTREYNHHHAIEAGVKRGLRIDDIEQIKQMIDSGLSVIQVAERLGIANERVGRVKKGWIRNLSPDEPTPYPYDPFWEHVSVSRRNRCPNWYELEQVKRTFFKDDETAVQYHVPPAEHINNSEHCLHLWRPLDVEMPRPPGILVGLIGKTQDEVQAMNMGVF